MEGKKVFSDDELVEEVSTEDDAPVQVIYRCKKCGQVLNKDAKDCWKCSGKEIEVVVEEDTKEVKKIMLQSQIDKLENSLKSIKKNNDLLYVIIGVLTIAVIISFFI